jgi:3-oxoacyl-[acyl-carrier-protein] synthase II
MGIVSAIGLSVSDFHQALLRNEVGIRVMKPNSPNASLYGLIHENFDPKHWMDDRIIAGTDRFAQFALAACAQALGDAGLDGEGALDKLRTGVVHGTSMGGTVSLQKNQWILDPRGPDRRPRHGGRFPRDGSG